MSHTRSVLALALTAMLLAGCGTRTLSRVSDGQTDRPVWPAPEHARPLLPMTAYPSVKILRKVAPGMDKTQVYRLLGHPHYREGMAGVREWDFLFKLPLPGEGQVNYATCQYKILFDNHMLARQFHWNPASCAQLVEAPVPADAPPVPLSQFEVSTDLLFDFDSAVLKASNPIDEEILLRLRAARGVELVRLEGHTDRIGTDAHNLDLSRRRAEAVKAYLVARGVPADIVEVAARGSTDPRVDCEQTDRLALIACLAPNRRVRVEIHGYEDP